MATNESLSSNAPDGGEPASKKRKIDDPSAAVSATPIAATAGAPPPPPPRPSTTAVGGTKEADGDTKMKDVPSSSGEAGANEGDYKEKSDQNGTEAGEKADVSVIESKIDKMEVDSAGGKSTTEAEKENSAAVNANQSSSSSNAPPPPPKAQVVPDQSSPPAPQPPVQAAPSVQAAPLVQAVPSIQATAHVQAAQVAPQAVGGTSPLAPPAIARAVPLAQVPIQLRSDAHMKPTAATTTTTTTLVGVQDLTAEHCPEDLTISPGRNTQSSSKTDGVISPTKGKSLKALCGRADVQTVKKAIEGGGKLNAACVFRAARNNKIDVLKYLLVEQKQTFRFATLTASTNQDVQKLLREHMDLLHPDDAKALREQEENAKRREEERQKEIARRQKQREQARPLEEACKEGDLEAAKTLLDEGAWCTWDGFEAVLEDKNRELFQALVKQGKILSVEPEDNDFAILDSTYFDQIWQNGWKDEVKGLLETGMKYDHENLDTDHKEQYNILRKFVKQLRFPFQYYSAHHRQGSMMQKAEDIVKINEKVKKFFEHKLENLEDDERTMGFMDGFKSCMDTYLSMD